MSELNKHTIQSIQRLNSLGITVIIPWNLNYGANNLNELMDEYPDLKYHLVDTLNIQEGTSDVSGVVIDVLNETVDGRVKEVYFSDEVLIPSFFRMSGRLLLVLVDDISSRASDLIIGASITGVITVKTVKELQL